MAETAATLAGLATLFAILAYFRIGALETRLAALSATNAKLDALLRHQGVAFDPYDGAPPGVADALARGDHIAAIKAYRDATGADLKAAKDFVDELRRRA